MRKVAVYFNKVRKLGVKNSILKAVGYDSAYTCCYRTSPQDSFLPMPYSKDLWYADPMLIEREGHKYVFMEVFDEKTHLGRIGYSELTEKGWGEVRTVISENFHLSFPYMFEYNGMLYMLPETSTANKVCLYECVRFPDEWVLNGTFLEGQRIVDSIILEKKDNIIRILGSECNRDNDLEYKFVVYDIIFGTKIEMIMETEINNRQEYYSYHRNAGPVFDDKYIPLQKSSEVIYGESMYLADKNEVRIAVENGRMVDTSKSGEMTLANCKIERSWLRNLVGTHTYGKIGNLEVMDVQFFRFNKYKWKGRLQVFVK